MFAKSRDMLSAGGCNCSCSFILPFPEEDYAPAAGTAHLIMRELLICHTSQFFVLEKADIHTCLCCYCRL